MNGEDSKTFVMELTLDAALYLARNLADVFVDELRLMNDVMPTPEERAMHLMQRGGPKWCAMDKSTKRPVFMGGVSFATTWRGETWVCGTVDWQQHIKVITRWSRHVLRTLLAGNESPVYRIEAISCSGPEETGRWFKMMGLQYEHALPGYCRDGHPAYLYAATRA